MTSAVDATTDPLLAGTLVRHDATRLWGVVANAGATRLAVRWENQ